LALVAVLASANAPIPDVALVAALALRSRCHAGGVHRRAASADLGQLVLLTTKLAFSPDRAMRGPARLSTVGSWTPLRPKTGASSAPVGSS
jgi:hypothetical protein